MTYSADAIAGFFDRYGEKEWQRFEQTGLAAVQLHLHNHYLRAFVPPGARVLEIGAGPGRFTETLHAIGCRIVVADISPVQLELNREYGGSRGFGASVEDRLRLDISDLSSLPDAGFDAVVAYGGPLSYVFERREQAAQGCRRVLRPGGVLVASVMSLWGTIHRHLPVVRDLPVESNRRIVATGDVTPENDPSSVGHNCHLYRSGEFTALLERTGFRIEALSASNALATHLEEVLLAIRPDPVRWGAFLELELEAAAQPGYVDGGTHLIAVGSA